MNPMIFLPKRRTSRFNWQTFRDKLTRAMRYHPTAPLHTCYSLGYGGRNYFGGDTFELIERVMKLARQDRRAAK
jgi:hypothetical protein